MKRKKTDRSEFKKFVDLTGAALLILCLWAAFTQFAHAKAYDSSQDFVQKATIGGMFEVQTSQLALQRSQNPNIKNFAQQMVVDHTKADSQLSAVLPNSTVSPSSITQSLDAPHQKMLDQLTADTDRDFDKDYIKDQKKAHKEATDLFKDYAKSGDDPTLKAFASQTLPTLKQHKKEIYSLKI